MKRLHHIFFILTILWMVVIFIFSSQPSDISSGTSGFFTNIVLDIFVPDYDSYDAARQQEIYDMASLIIRKCAHFTEYAILSSFAFVTILSKRWMRRTDGYISVNTKQAHGDIFRSCRLRSLVVAVVFSILYAVTDELHQGFVDGRVPAPLDVAIDGLGALFGALVITLFISKYYHKKYKVRRKKLPG